MDHWEMRNELFQTLTRDVDENFARLSTDSSQNNRRNYVRSLFALIESVVCDLREVLSQSIVRKYSETGEFNIHEIIPLLDKKVIINNKGELQYQSNNHSSANLIKYVFKELAKSRNVSNIIFDDDWKHFQEFIQIRNRLSHPKYESNIDVSDTELENIKKGRLWFNRTIQLLHNY